MGTEPGTDEKRRFHRVLFDTKAHLSTPDRRWSVHVIDLSLNGALITIPDDWTGGAGVDFRLEIPLDEEETAIHMEVSIAHEDPQRMGLRCRYMDVDSISNLRRLVELNLGNMDLLTRDLAALIK